MKTISGLVKYLFGGNAKADDATKRQPPSAADIERKRQLVLARRAQRAKAK